uniref:Uncharacterized protein n=1 Tax=Salix viminalis TaxID=40686 RepID=A0A6N2N5K2_SALVM
MFATIILLYGGVRYEVSKPDSLTDSLPRRRTSRNDVEFDFLDPLFTHQLWPPRHRLLRSFMLNGLGGRPDGSVCGDG